MKYRTLGRTGVSVSEIGFGAWALGGGWGDQPEEDSMAALGQAIDLGVNFIDTAAGYGDGRSERIIGRVIQERREKLFVATKTPPAPGPWPPSPYCTIEERYPESYLRDNIEERRRNLGVDTIDLLQLHTWTRAWNKNPRALDTLKKLQAEGKIRHIGISTPEQDQNAVIDLMRRGYLDTVQVIYNIFEQEPAAELLPAALEHKVGVIVRVVFDEGALTGKFHRGQKFADEDFRSRYFAGDRVDRVVERVARIEEDVRRVSPDRKLTMPEVAILFALAHPAVSSVIPGIRNVAQARANTAVSELAPLSDALRLKLRGHAWLRGVWYGGK
jgi:aryl-alcohol dehydrogenase-like predicted oxidoreductase